MKFTDDDKAYLKHEMSPDNNTDIWFYHEYLEGLFSRLEAAEVLAEVYSQYWPNNKSTKKWLKAAGKDKK